MYTAGGENEKGDGVIGKYHDICTIYIPATAATSSATAIEAAIYGYAI